MKNVAFFIDDISGLGGTEHVTCNIANMLAETSNFNVYLITLNFKYTEIKYKLSQNITLLKINKRPKNGKYRFPVICCKLRRYLKRFRIDFLIDVDGILDLYAIPAKMFLHTRLISWEHFNYYQNPGVPYRKLSRQLAGIFADYIVTLTEHDKAAYLSNLRIRNAEVISIPNPISIESSLEHDINAKTILSAGRLTYQKGFDMLIEVAKQVLPGHPDWRWIVLGDGEEQDSLLEQTQKLGLAKQLHFPGRKQEIGQYLDNSACFVLTSRFEGLPMVLLESKAHHLPIISFDCPTGPNELIEDGVNGYLIPCFDTDAMASSINALIDDHGLLTEFANNSQKGLERYSTFRVLSLWNSILLK